MTDPTRSPLLDAAWHALRDVYDPELALDIVSIGLVYDVRLLDPSEPGARAAIEIDMTLTTPGCPVSESLPDEARAAVEEAVGGEADVRLAIVWDPPWTPERISPEAAVTLGFHPKR